METLSGKTVAVMLEAGSSVPDLKSAIYAKEGVSVEQQLLVSAGKYITTHVSCTINSKKKSPKYSLPHSIYLRICFIELALG